MTSDHLITCRDLVKIFRTPDKNDILVLDHVNLDIQDGEIYCLLGPSGCGKSTLLKAMAGFDLPTSGTVTIADQPIRKPGPDRAVVSQRPNLFPWQSILDNVMYPVRLRYGKNGSRKYVDKANQYMAAMGLQSFAKHYPYQLSGGMQQRAAIARALMCEPRVLLMDEPFGGLDAQTKIVMQELVRELWALYKTTIFFITHDVDEAILLGHK